MSGAKPQSKAVLSNMYKFLSGHSSCARSAAENVVDERIEQLAEEVFELDETNILLDLRRLNGKPNATLLTNFGKSLRGT